jgi:hypothetical protein
MARRPIVVSQYQRKIQNHPEWVKKVIKAKELKIEASVKIMKYVMNQEQ